MEAEKKGNENTHQMDLANDENEERIPVSNECRRMVDQNCKPTIYIANTLNDISLLANSTIHESPNTQKKQTLQLKHTKCRHQS